MRLPDSFAPLFRNYRWETIDDRKHSELIVKTTLAYGSWDQIRWLFQHYGKDEIGTIFRRDYYGMRSLPESTRRLWELLFIPEEERENEPRGPSRWRGRREVPSTQTSLTRHRQTD